MGRAEQRRMDDLEKRLYDLAKKVAARGNVGAALQDLESRLRALEATPSPPQPLDLVSPAAFKAFGDAAQVARKGPVEVDQETKKRERGPVPPGVPTPKKASDR